MSKGEPLTVDVALALEEGLWDALKHPRGRGGEWANKLGGEIAKAAEETGEKIEKAKVERPTIVRKERPLHQTEAFRRGLRRVEFMREFGSHGDEFMYDLAVDRGFAGKPKVVTDEQLAAHIADGDRELWRGVSDASYAADFLKSPPYYGQGFRGNGIYAASGGRAHAMARAYAVAPPTRGITAKADKPVVIHMALAKEAKTISYEDASMRARHEHTSHVGAKGGGEGQASSREQVLAEAASSPTRWALANGFDAVIVSTPDGGDEVVVLNRTALIVSKDFESAGQNVARASRAAA